MIIQALINLGWDKPVAEEDGVINWFGETPIDEALIKAEISRLQTEHDNNQYQRDRQYPSIGDQLDMIFHAGLGGDAFQAAIQAVKDKHPKGGN